MRAAVLTEVNKPLQILDLEQEGPKAGEARVKVKAAGICMSDWHIMIGDWPLPLPMVLGHEAAGEVVEVGPGVTNVKKGDHVIFSFRPHCGHCMYCSKGRTVLCIGHNDTPRWVMHDGTARVRLQRRAHQPDGAHRHLHRVFGVPGRAARAGAQGSAVDARGASSAAAWRRASARSSAHANVEAGSSVLVIGCGGVGLNVVQGAKLAGAGKHHRLRPARQQAATSPSSSAPHTPSMARGRT